MQFLAAGFAKGEPGLFLSLEEDAPQLVESARQFGWHVDEAIKSGSLKIMRLDPKETKQSLQRIQGSFGKELSRSSVRSASSSIPCPSSTC